MGDHFTVRRFSNTATASVVRRFCVGVLLSGLISLVGGSTSRRVSVASGDSGGFHCRTGHTFVVKQVGVVFPGVLYSLSGLSIVRGLCGRTIQYHSRVLPKESFPEGGLGSGKHSRFEGGGTTLWVGALLRLDSVWIHLFNRFSG